MKRYKPMEILELIKQRRLKRKVILEKVDLGKLCKKNTLYINNEIVIDSCIFINDFLAPYFFNKKILLKNCVFNKKFVLSGGMFYKKVIIENSIFTDYSSFGAGVSFMDKTTLSNNIFYDFLDINDAEFKENMTFTNNILKKGTNLLGNKGKPYEVTFDKKPIIEGNQGVLDMDVLP